METIVVTTMLYLMSKELNIVMVDGMMMISLCKKCAVLVLLIDTLFVLIKQMEPLM